MKDLTRENVARILGAACIMALAVGSIPDGWRQLIGGVALLAFAYVLNGRRPSQRPVASRHWKKKRRHKR